MLTETKVTKLFALIAEKQKLSAKIAKALSPRKPHKAKKASNGHSETPRVSKAVRSQRKLQGRYLGAVRRLSKGQRKAVAKVREESGYLKAIAAAKRLAKEA